MNSRPDPRTDVSRDLTAAARTASALGAVEGFLDRFVVWPSVHARLAAALWVAHTYRIDSFDSTPRIAFLSPEPGSGKTRALEVIGSLVRHPITR